MEKHSTWAPLRPSPTTWERKSFNVPLTILACIGLLAVFFVVPILYAAVAIPLGFLDPRHLDKLPARQLLIMQVVSYVPVAVYLPIVLPRLAHRSLAQLGFRAPKAADVGYGLLGAVLMFLVIDVVGGILASVLHRRDVESAVALLGQLQTVPEKILFVAMAAVFAPMIEELIFRAFLFNAFARYVPFWIAALASGALFGLAHFDPQGAAPLSLSVGAHHVTVPAQYVTISVPLALGGVVLAWIYARTNCYWASVISHATFNSVSTILLLMHVG